MKFIRSFLYLSFVAVTQMKLDIIVRRFFLWLILISACFCSYSQTSSGNGLWSVGSNWSGGAAPPVTGGWVTIDVQHDILLNGNYSLSGTLNVQASGILTISNNVTITGGSNLHVYGILNIEGNTTLTSNLVIHPGGKVIIDGTVSVAYSQYLTVGNDNEPLPYADLVIKTDLMSQSSGDIEVNRNGRVAIYGDVTNDGGGGTVFTINDGGQVYVHGDVTFTGGGDQIINNNSSNPSGFYVNGTVTNSGGGSSSSSNVGDQDDMEDSNPSFHEWVGAQSDSPLPVTLAFFKAQSHGESVMLLWQTETEVNNDFFTVEKSIDGKSFVKADQVAGNGTSSFTNQYSWMDNSPVRDLTYYRLSQTDFDGATKILGLRSVSASHQEANVSFYPNPVRAGEAITIFGSIPQVLKVYNQAGQLVYQAEPLHTRVDLPALQSGVYLLRFEMEGGTLTKKLVIQ